MNFKIEATDGLARAGELQTDHGLIKTPIFMPVGTVGSVKAVPFSKMANPVNAQIMLGNTYHLYLRPGTDVLEAAGGIHSFNGWKQPVLTDSGGYQVFSLAENRKLSEEGATFKSHIDGSKHQFTPEKVISIQRSIGADIIMAFDECPPYPSTYEYAHKSMQLTHRWLDRCIKAMAETSPIYGHKQVLFPIIQGGTYSDLRKISANFCAERGEGGVAIGGLSVGEPVEDMYRITAECTQLMPENQPRYLMGVGTPANILTCIGLGVDMFDCVMPTRNGRNGYIFTTEGVLNIKNKKWEKDFSPIDPHLDSEEANHSKAYVRHLFMAGELLGLEIASVQNLSLYLWMMGQAREKIQQKVFFPWAEEMSNRLMRRL